MCGWPSFTGGPGAVTVKNIGLGLLDLEFAAPEGGYVPTMLRPGESATIDARAVHWRGLDDSLNPRLAGVMYPEPYFREKN